jgi:type I restriction enzyme M protein
MITKQALGSTLFGMADILRDKVEDYKSYILTLLFFKRLSDNYQWEIDNQVKDFEVQYGKKPNQKQFQKIVDKAHDFILPEGCHWGDVRKASEAKKNDVLNRAVNRIAEVNPALKGVINTVKWNEPSPDGSGGKKLSPVVLTQLINYLDSVDLSNKNASVDVLGDAYEYLIKKFADENKGGTTAGQFYTPQEVVDIIVRYTKPKKDEEVYDPTCGSGGFLINSAKYIKEKYNNPKAIRLYGQEDVWNTWAIANINMILHGLDAQVKKEDTLRNPQFKDGKEIQKFDLVLANFPFSLDNWWKNGKPKKDKKGKPVLTKDGKPQLTYPDKNEFSDPWDRFGYGIPPFSNGDFAFLQHIIASLNEQGRAGVVCPQGVLFRGQPAKTEEEDGQNRKADDEYEIRRKFITGLEDADGHKLETRNLLDAIVVLPSNLFYGTTIPGCILFFNKAKPKDRKNKVLMIYAAYDGWFKEETNLNVLLPHDMLRIMTLLESWGNVNAARSFIPSEEIRLHKKIQEQLDFKVGEIEQAYYEDILFLENRIAEIQANERNGKSKEKEIAKRKEALQKFLKKKASDIFDAQAKAAKEKLAIESVKNELFSMFSNSEIQKRYFSIVDLEVLRENEFNLNIPRYVDTFLPERQIDLKTEIEQLISLTNQAKNSETALLDLLQQIR